MSPSRLRTPLPLTLVAVAALTALGACASDQDTTAPTATAATATAMASPQASSPSAKSSPAASTPTTAAAARGRYVEQAAYTPDTSANANTVVFFFHAPWCPSCRATDQALTSQGVPDGITVVKVDFDSATDLRQKYGVTTQHTFVQLDGAGESVKKWSGSADGSNIAAQVGR